MKFAWNLFNLNVIVQTFKFTFIAFCKLYTTMILFYHQSKQVGLMFFELEFHILFCYFISITNLYPVKDMLIKAFSEVDGCFIKNMFTLFDTDNVTSTTF